MCSLILGPVWPVFAQWGVDVCVGVDVLILYVVSATEEYSWKGHQGHVKGVSPLLGF